MCSFSAARLKLPSAATITKYLKCRSSITGFRYQLDADPYPAGMKIDANDPFRQQTRPLMSHSATTDWPQRTGSKR
jgi:hypothetical protein